MGAALAGITVVTVNPAYTALELGYVLGHSRCSGIVMVPAYRGVDLFGVLDVARSVAPVPALREVLELTTWRPTPTDDGHGLPAVAPNSAAMIQYTSGTTGFPKGAMLSHHGMVNNAMLFGRRFQLAPGSTWVNPLPMFHVGGCAFSALGALCRRATHVLLAFEPRLALQLIEEERGTFLPAVPTMLMAMLEHPDFATFDLSSLEVVMSGGASIPPELVQRVESHMGAKFGAVFGQTETCGVICISHPSDSTPDKTLRVGQPLEQSEVKIVAAGSDIPVPCGEVGEICVRGFGVMLGYFDAAEQTAQTVTSDGWLHTGDLGTMEDRGYLAVTGRLKEMIIRGGENIFPREIEDRLHDHPDVADVAVVGIADARWGEQAVAFVRPSAGASPDPLELEAFLRERLAGHKVPRRWVMLDELPLTLSGKVQKFRLREQFEAGAFDR